MKKYTFWLWGAIILQLLTAALHSLSFVNPMQPSNEREGQLIDLLQNHYIDFGSGFERTFSDIFNSLSISFMLLLLLGGLINWYLIKKEEAKPIIRGVLNIQLITFLACFINMAFFAFLPPIVLTGLIAFCLSMARLLLP